MVEIKTKQIEKIDKGAKYFIKNKPFLLYKKPRKNKFKQGEDTQMEEYIEQAEFQNRELDNSKGKI